MSAIGSASRPDDDPNERRTIVQGASRYSSPPGERLDAFKNKVRPAGHGWRRPRHRMISTDPSGAFIADSPEELAESCYAQPMGSHPPCACYRLKPRDVMEGLRCRRG